MRAHPSSLCLGQWLVTRFRLFIFSCLVWRPALGNTSDDFLDGIFLYKDLKTYSCVYTCIYRRPFCASSPSSGPIWKFIMLYFVQMQRYLTQLSLPHNLHFCSDFNVAEFFFWNLIYCVSGGQIVDWDWRFEIRDWTLNFLRYENWISQISGMGPSLVAGAFYKSSHQCITLLTKL